MLLLVFPDRNMCSAIEKDVGSLEDRIIEKRNRLAFPIFPGLVLPLGHSIKPAHAGGAVEYPAQLGMRRYGLCESRTDLLGSIPLAIHAAAISRTLARRSAGSIYSDSA
jgi:hypothetical protein